MRSSRVLGAASGGLAGRLLAALIGVEIVVWGWWAVTRETPTAVLLQLGVAAVAGTVALGLRYRTVRLDYQQGIAVSAVAHDRTRLAEQLHDALGHDLSVVALRAGALQLQVTGPASDEAAALRGDADQAVTRLREAVLLLRSGPGTEAPYEPAREPLEELVARTVAAGADVKIVGVVPDGLPETVEQTMHAVVREGLTNAARHAPMQPVTIRLTPSAAAIEIAVVNVMTDRAVAPASSTGSGIAALRRRVNAIGGKLDAGADARTHRLAVRLPRDLDSLDGALAPSTVVTPHRTPLRAIAVPTAIVCAAIVAFYTWSTHGATLEDDVFAAVRLGASEESVRRAVPDREAVVRLASPPPHPRAWDCGQFSDGNFPLGMATFEICYHDQQVVRTIDLRRRDGL